MPAVRRRRTRRRRTRRRRRECVACDLRVTEKERGLVPVDSLRPGDAVLGRDPQDFNITKWCRVHVAVRTGFGELHGNFTATHVVVNGSGHVEPNGENATARQGDLCQLATECPGVNFGANGVVTPYSTAFCNRNMTWREYVALHAAILRVVAATGTFWLDPSSFDDNGSFEEEQNMSEVQAPSFTMHTFPKSEVMEADWAGRWMEGLPDLCDGILECSMDWKCDKFEPVIDNLVRRHLKEEFRSMVLEKYPSLGVVGSGISKDIKAPSFLLVVLFWIACSVVLFVVILCLFCFGRKIKL